MTISHTNRVHICGANGHLATRFISAVGQDIQILRYSSQTSQSGETTALPLSELPKRAVAGERVIFFSYSSRPASEKVVTQLLIQLQKIRVQIVFVSTMAIYSDYRSRYAEIKLAQEEIVKSFESWQILRLGFVFARDLQGLSQTFKRLAKFRLLFLPGQGVGTYFINLATFIEALKSYTHADLSNEIHDHYEVRLDLERTLQLFGFVGTVIRLPSLKSRVTLITFKYLKSVTPKGAQSILSLVFMSNVLPQMPSERRYLRRFLLTDYARCFGSDDIWRLRDFVVAIEQQNHVQAYLDLNRSARFMLLQRLKELINASRLQRLE